VVIRINFIFLNSASLRPTKDKLLSSIVESIYISKTLISLYMIERNDKDLEFKDPKELFRVVTKELSLLVRL